MVVKNEFRTTNQHDHVLRSNAWPCFSFRATNQHDHVLRSNIYIYIYIYISFIRTKQCTLLQSIYVQKKREKKPLEQCNNKIEKKERCYSTDTKV